MDTSVLSDVARYYTENTPVVLYLYGNDGCSYSKYVSSNEEAESELFRLGLSNHFGIVICIMVVLFLRTDV